MSAASLPRHLLKWVLSLDLTYPIKHPKRDFANGFLVAEILSKYFPDDVQMHSFENVTSIQRKKSNWHLLKRFFKRYDVAISQTDVEQVMAAEDGAIVRVLQTIYDYVHEDPAAQATQQPPAEQRIDFCRAASSSGHPQDSPAMQPSAYGAPAIADFMHPDQPAYLQHMHSQPSGSAYTPHQAGPATHFSGFAYPSGGPGYTPVVAQPSQAAGWQQHPAGLHQLMAMQQQAQAQHVYGANASMPHHMQHAAGVGQQAPALQAMHEAAYSADPRAASYPGQASAPSIEYDRRPRAVEYKPYTQQDYSSRNYDAKMQKEYWKLGTLGPQIEDEDLQAKRRKAEELKELARSIRDKNARLASMASAAAKPKLETPKSKSVREKALEFARNVPKPDSKRAASSGSSSGENTPQPQRRTSGLSEIERLQAQHAEHRQRVESIRQEFVKIATS